MEGHQNGLSKLIQRRYCHKLLLLKSLVLHIL